MRSVAKKHNAHSEISKEIVHQKMPADTLHCKCTRSRFHRKHLRKMIDNDLGFGGISSVMYEEVGLR